MLMPIVSMNEMAMNESIAAGCCFREAVSGSTNVYWQTLYGGSIHSGYVAKTPKALTLNYPNWKTFGFDIALKDANAYGITFKSGLDGVVVYQNAATGVEFTTVEGYLSRYEIAKGKDCDHKDPWTCNYYEKLAQGDATQYVENHHFDSTAVHAKNAVGVPHPALQYNS